LEPTSLGFQDDAREFLRDRAVRGIFLVMCEVTERGFAAAMRDPDRSQGGPGVL
jgi:hypothetical protein